MEMTRQQARELQEENSKNVLKKIHKQMLKNGKKNKLFAELKKRYPTRELFGMKFPEYIKFIEDEIQQEEKLKK